MGAIQRRRSLILVAIMMLAAVVPSISPYDIEDPILEDEEPIMETGTGPEMVTNLNQAMTIGDSDADRVHAMANGPNGSVYFIGEFEGTISFQSGYSLTSGQGDIDVFIAKLKNDGQWAWAAQISGSQYTDRGYGIAVDSSGNAYVTGSFYSTCYFYSGTTGQVQGNATNQGSNGSDIYVAMIKNNGQWEWIASAGGYGNEQGNDIAVDASGNSFVTGYVGNGTVFTDSDGGSTTVWGMQGSDIFAAKLDYSGNWKWIKTAGGMGDDIGTSIDVDPSGDAYITGYYTNDSAFGNSTTLYQSSSSSSKEMFVARVFDSPSSGQVSWSWAVPFTGPGATEGTSISVDNGNVYATGFWTTNITASTLGAGGWTTSWTVGTINTVAIKLTQSSGQILWINDAKGSGIIKAYDLLISDTEIILSGSYMGSNYFGNYDISNSFVSSDGFIAALNPSNGEWNWSERIESGNGEIKVNNIETGPDGSLTVAGFFEGTINLLGTNLSASGSGSLEDDIFIANIKYAKEGCYVNGTNYNNQSQWSACLGGKSEMVIDDGITDSAGNFYIIGSFSGTAVIWGEILVSSGGNDIFIGKVNNNEAWVVKAGGTGSDKGYGIDIDSSGNIYVTGHFQGTATFGSTDLTDVGGSDIFIAKLNSSLSWEWAVKAGGSSTDRGYEIAVDSSGNAYATGYFRGTGFFGSATLTSSGSYDIFIAKLSSSGSWQWAVKAGGTGSEDSGRGIAVEGGNVYAIGNFEGTATFGSTSLTSSGDEDIFIAKLSSSGSWLWAVKAGGSGTENGYGIALDSNSNVYVTGSFEGTATFGSTSLTSFPSYEVFVAKLSSSGSWQWVVKAGGSSNGGGRGLGIDVDSTSGNTYVTGHFHENTIIGSTTLTSSGSSDIFIAKLSSSGSWLWAVSVGGSDSDYAMAISVDSSENVYATGYFSGTATFGNQNLSCANINGWSCGFLAKVETPLLPPDGKIQANLVWNSATSDLEGDYMAYDLITNYNYTVVYKLQYTSNDTLIGQNSGSWFASTPVHLDSDDWNMQIDGLNYGEQYTFYATLWDSVSMLDSDEINVTIPQESNYTGNEWYEAGSGIEIDENNDSWDAWINVSSMPANTDFNITYSVELAYDSVSLTIFNDTLEYESWDGTETKHFISHKTLSENVMSIAGRSNHYCLDYDIYHSITGVAATGGSICHFYDPPVSNDGDWIPDSYEGAFTQTSSSSLDTDGDGWGDWIEHWGGSDPSAPSSTPTDADNDGLPYLLEEMMGTSDNDNDSDGDGALDFDDFRYGGHPARASYLPPNGDWDSCWDYWEDQVGLNSSNPDSDGDGVYDCFESDPWNASSTPTDTDGDGLPDDLELLYNTDASDPDSDGDGVPDSAEIGGSEGGTNPNDELAYNVNYWSDFGQTLEQFGTVTASTTATIYSANNVLDDDHLSYWQPENPCPGWIEIDLGNVYRPSYIEVSIFNDNYDDDYPREFVIETRENPSDNWSNISSFSFGDDLGLSGAFGGYTELHKVRYVRIYCISSNDILEVPHDIAFSEITIYDSTNLQYVDLSAIDNQTTGGTDPTGPTVPTDAPSAPVHDEATVISLFSDEYTDVPGTGWSPSWSQNTIYTAEFIAGNNVIKYQNLDYMGVALDSNQYQDVSDFTHVYFDYWTADATFLGLSLISPGPLENSASAGNIVTGSWQGVDISLSQYTIPDLSNIFQLKFEGSGTVYIDNLYFYGGDNSGTNNNTNNNTDNNTNNNTDNNTDNNTNNDADSDGVSDLFDFCPNTRAATEWRGDYGERLTAWNQGKVEVDSDGCEVNHVSLLTMEFHEESMVCQEEWDEEYGICKEGDLIWTSSVEFCIEDPWIGYNHTLHLQLWGAEGSGTDYDIYTIFDFQPLVMDYWDPDVDGWWEMAIGPPSEEPQPGWDQGPPRPPSDDPFCHSFQFEQLADEDNPEDYLETLGWVGDTRFLTIANTNQGDLTIEYPYFSAGEYCLQVSIGYQISMEDSAMMSYGNLFDAELHCDTFEHAMFEGFLWDGYEEEEPQSTLEKVMSNKIVSSLLDFMDSTQGQILSIGLALLGFAGRMVLARGQRAKNKRVTKFSKAIRKANSRGRLKILEMDIEKANNKGKLPRGGFGDLMEQIESQMESLGFGDDPDQGSTSGNWTSGDEMQQESEMMWDAQDMMGAQDMMEDAREEAMMTRQAVEDLQDRLNIDTRYGEEPVSKGPRYERSGVRLSDSAASTGPSLPGSKEGGLEAKPDLVASILSQNIAPKDNCHCGSGKMYKDCHMKKGKKKKKKW